MTATLRAAPRAKLTRLLGMLGSHHAGEHDAAAVAVKDFADRALERDAP